MTVSEPSQPYPRSSRGNEEPDFRQDVAEWVLAMPAAMALGFSFATLGDGRCQTRLRWQRKHSHVPGAFQAGPIGSLADFTGASAAITTLAPGTLAATVDFTVKLLTEARGDLLIATGRALQPVGTLIVAAVDIDVVDSGTRSPCATALVTIRARRATMSRHIDTPGTNPETGRVETRSTSVSGIDR
jgi:uncharacterized protein (TIGR00369 family)